MADFTRALDIDPTYGDVYLYRGRAHAENLDTDDAIRDFTDAIYFDEFAAAYAARGGAYVDNDEARKAIADLTKSLSLDKKGRGGKVLTLLGEAHEALGEYDHAIEQFTAYIDTHPQDLTYAYYTRGKCHAKKGDWQAAIADFTRAIDGEDDPYSSYFTERGKAYRSAGNFESAIADFKTNIAKGFVTYSHFDLAETYRAMKDETNARAEYEAAIAVATATIEKYPESISLAIRGRANLALGEHAKAVEDLTRIIATTNEKYYYFEDRTAYLTDRANAYLALGDTANAEADRAEAARLRETASARQNAPPEEVATRAQDDRRLLDGADEPADPATIDSRSRLDGAADMNSGEGGIRSLRP